MVEIVIYDAPTTASSGCACGCGGHSHGQGHSHAHEDPFARVSVEKQARALAMTLEKDFPGRVQVEYINVLKDPRGPQLPQTKLLCSMTHPTPLVYLNGPLRRRHSGGTPPGGSRRASGRVSRLNRFTSFPAKCLSAKIRKPTEEAACWKYFLTAKKIF